MTESPDPVTTWWALLTPEVRKFWFQRITGWSVEGAMKAAFAEAVGEREEAAAVDPGDAPLDPAGNPMPGTPMFDSEASDG
jgi:hypothetical protein